MCAARLWMALGALVLALPAVAQAGDLRLVSDVEMIEGKQVQRPVWAPGTSPRLVHEITDRNRLTWLRVVGVEGAGITEEVIPGSRSSRLESLGAASDRADTGVTWWDESSFFFVRSVGGSSSLFYFDGIPREVPDLPGRVDEVQADPTRGRLYASIETKGAIDLYSLSGKGFTEEKVRLTFSAGSVEHAVSVRPEQGALFWISATRAGTRLGGADPPQPDGVRERLPANKIEDYELISLTVLPGLQGMVAYARVPAGAVDPEVASHILLHMSDPQAGTSKLTELVRDIYVPPGLAPRPAFSDGGNTLYYIAESPERGNPVMKLDRTTGKKTQLSLGTHGNQEISVSEYGQEGSAPVTWLAVVSVGDGEGEDVGNHLYIGPLGSWPGW